MNGFSAHELRFYHTSIHANVLIAIYQLIAACRWLVLFYTIAVHCRHYRIVHENAIQAQIKLLNEWCNVSGHE